MKSTMNVACAIHEHNRQRTMSGETKQSEKTKRKERKNSKKEKERKKERNNKTVSVKKKTIVFTGAKLEQLQEEYQQNNSQGGERVRERIKKE